MSTPSRAAPATYLAATFVAAITAALASALALAAGLPVWAMFIGWIAFFSRGLTTRSTLDNFGCVTLGLATGAFAAMAVGMLAPEIGLLLAMPLVVFVVALIVVALRGLPVLNNLLGWFLGLVAWFAAHLEPAAENVAQLAAAAAIGSIAGWISHHVPRLTNP